MNFSAHPKISMFRSSIKKTSKKSFVFFCLLLLGIFYNYSYPKTAITATNDFVPDCPLTSQSGRTIVRFRKWYVRSDSSYNNAISGPENLSLAAGTYRLTVVSYEQHNEDGERDEFQPHEQWYMELQNSSGSEIASTPTSTDIPESQDLRIETLTSSFRIPAPITRALAVHTYYPEKEYTNSVHPVCAAFDSVNAPTPTPTPLIPTTTVAPTVPGETYTISGTVFNDLNKNKIKEPSETNFVGRIDIRSTGGTVTTTRGSYTISDLAAGTYRISYHNLPYSYNMIHPLNGPPPSFTVRVGPGCSVTDNATGGSCNTSNNVINLHFAISGSLPWIQGTGLNMRFDSGTDNFIAANPACSPAFMTIPGSSTTSGIVYSGDSKTTYGNGSPNAEQWVVGGVAYPEVYRSSQPLASSYNTVLANVNKAGAVINNLASFCNTANCTLPSSLAAGVYQANGNLRLNAYRFRNNENYIFLVNGTVTFLGDIEVPNQSTALFTSSSDIIVSSNLGIVPTCGASCICNASADLQGIYSADRNFTVQGINDCSVGPDRKLTFEGAVFVNAALGSGKFTNYRDLCSYNNSYPSIVFKERTSFITNAPKLLKQRILNFREEAP